MYHRQKKKTKETKSNYFLIRFTHSHGSKVINNTHTFETLYKCDSISIYRFPPPDSHSPPPPFFQAIVNWRQTKSQATETESV